jgi:hypothetical protein
LLSIQVMSVFVLKRLADLRSRLKDQGGVDTHPDLIGHRCDGVRFQSLVGENPRLDVVFAVLVVFGSGPRSQSKVFGGLSSLDFS